MSQRYSADVHAMTAAANRLDGAADELDAVAALLGGRHPGSASGSGRGLGVDDPGPGSGFGDLGEIGDAVAALAAELADRVRELRPDLLDGAAQVRAARDAYLDVDRDIAEELHRGG